MSSSSIIHPVTGMPISFGRRPLRHNADSRARMAKLTAALQALPPDFAPTIVDNTSGITSWGMMLNDTLGDCTIACPGHMEQAWTAKSGTEITIPDTAILTAYEQFDGYVAGDPSTDQGGDILTVCQDWQSVGIGGHKIAGFAHVNMTQENWQQALYLYGALNTGLNFPQSALAQLGGTLDLDPSKPPDPPDPTLGHCVALVYGGPDLAGFVSWGAMLWCTWRFVMYYFNECVACQSSEWTPPVTVPDGLQLVGL